MSKAIRLIRSARIRYSLCQLHRAWLRSALIAGLGFAGIAFSPSSLLAQDTNNSSTLNLQTNAVLSSSGTYNNLSTGVINFNGPSGAAEWSATDLAINNAGSVNLYRANLGIIGDVTNSGSFQIANLGGIVQVDGHFTNSGTTGSLQILGGGMELIGDFGSGVANFTNNSTAATGVAISANRYLIADTITNASGATIANSGRLEGRTAIINNGTLNSNTATSSLVGNITNQGTLQARGSVQGNVTNAATHSFTVTGNLEQSGDFSNQGTLAVSGGNLTSTGDLTNTSTLTIASGRTLTTDDVDNNAGGSITLGSNAILSGNTLENRASISVGAGGTLRSTSTDSNDDLRNTASGTITFTGSTGTANLSSASGEIVNQGTINFNAGTVLVTGNVSGTGTLAIGNGAIFKTGSANQSIGNAMSFAGVSTHDTNGFDATISGNISGSGGLSKTGLGTLTLNGTNTFSGPTSITGGQLTLTGGNALANNNAVTIGSAGRLHVQDNETIGSLAGAAGSEASLAADLRTGGTNANTTFSGLLAGSGRLIKEGTGTMTLNGSSPNTLSGGILVENGTLVANTNQQLGTGQVIVGPNNAGSAGSLAISDNTTQTIAGLEINSDTGTSAPRGVVNNFGTLTSNSNIANSGTINNLLGTSVINGGITNRNANALIDNNGTIHGGVTNEGGQVDNDTATSTIHGGLENTSDGVVNNTGTINGGVFNSATLNSDTATSVIAGGFTNQGAALMRNQVSGAIVNESQQLPSPAQSTFTVSGNLQADSTFTNSNTAQLHVRDGNFSGITTLTNESSNATGVQIDATRTLSANSIINQHGSTILNSGTLQSTMAIDNRGTLTNNSGATIQGGIQNSHPNSLITNNGTINGGITQNQGTVNSLNANSAIHGGVNNSGYVNARGVISGAIVNQAQHSFTDITLTHSQANASGMVTFGSGASSESFNITASSGTAVGSEGNGQKIVSVIFDANPSDIGTSSYDVSSDTIIAYVAGATASVQEIQDAINNGSGFTASGGSLTATIDSDGTTDPLSGGRDSGTALIRVLADATGSANQNRTIAIQNDSSIAADSAVAEIDSATGNIHVRVNGDVDYTQIADAIDDVNGYNASVTSSVGDQGYTTTLDTPPVASTLTNGVFNVEGDLTADSSFTNGGHLNLNTGNLTGITSLSNTGDIAVADGLRLQAGTVNNVSGNLQLGYDSALEADSLTNNATIQVHGEGDVASNGAITNSSTGVMTFGLGSTATNDVSELYSGSNSITNDGRIEVTQGTLLATGNISGTGTIAMSDDTTFQSGNNNQSISNNMTLANGGSTTFNTAGNNATISGAISGNGQFLKSGSGNLTLSGTNTFSGPAVINSGQLTLQDGNAIADTTAVRLNAGILRNNSTETIGSLTTASGTQTTLDATLTTGGNNSNTTASGVINGAAGLVKQGTGTMTLNGSVANTFAGGTTVHGGTLAASSNQQLGTGRVTVGSGANLTTGNGTTQTIAGLTNQGTVSLGNNATLNAGTSHFVNSGTVNVGTNASILDVGAITNSGAINFSGGTATLSSGTNSITNTGNINLNAGTVLVRGNLLGTGSINMNSGTTLRSGNANQQIANGIVVNSGTAVIDTNGNNVNLTGTIGGSGNLNKIGSGDLTWVGVNHGSAAINSGLLITSTQSQVGNVNTVSGAGVIFDQQSNGTYSGNVTGGGSLTKTGAGTVTMMGTSVYSGGTQVLGGTLRVGQQGTGQVQSNVNVRNGGTLGGGGTIVGNVSTQQGGRLAAGNSIGTLNVTGNLDATNSTVENELNATTSDLINVTGTANITGAVLENHFDPSATYATRMFRGLNATGGITGRFQSVNNFNAPSNTLISTYYTPTTANVVLTSLADATLANSTSTALLNSGQDHLTTIMNQINGYQFGGLGLLPANQQQPTGRNVWFKGTGNFSDMDSVGVTPGYSANTSGGIVGIDRALDNNTHFGIAGGYTFTNLHMKNAARANAEVNTARLCLYGAHTFDYVTLSAIGGYAYHDVEGKRNLVGIGTATGNQSQNEASANLQLTANPNLLGPSLLPYVGVQWVHLAQGAFTERGTPGFDFTVKKDEVDSLRPYIGLGFQNRLVTGSGLVAVPYLFSRYSRETIANSNLTNISINGSNFAIAGVAPNRNIVSLGGGINAQFRQNVDWYMNYNIDLGDRGTNQNVAGGFGFKF